MTLATRMIRIVRTASLCIVGLGASIVATQTARAEDPRVDVSVQIPVGDQGSFRVAYRDDDEYEDHHDRRASWAERLHENFYLLTENRHKIRRALRGFGRLAEQRPNAPLPKIGYALAQLRLGREHDAIWAMRRVVRLDTASLYRVPSDYSLHDIVHRLSQRVARDADHGRYNSDEWFLLATLRVISGHEQLARDAIRYALDEGDESYTLHALARHLGVQIHQYNDRYNRRGSYNNRGYQRQRARHHDRNRYGRHGQRGHHKPRHQRNRHHNRRGH